MSVCASPGLSLQPELQETSRVLVGEPLPATPVSASFQSENWRKQDRSKSQAALTADSASSASLH